jgi:hypothetical protein
MMLRDKIRIAAATIGVCLVGIGCTISFYGGSDEPIRGYRVGAWKDMPVARGLPKYWGPSLLVAGAVMVGTVYATRNR